MLNGGRRQLDNNNIIDKQQISWSQKGSSREEVEKKVACAVIIDEEKRHVADESEEKEKEEEKAPSPQEAEISGASELHIGFAERGRLEKAPATTSIGIVRLVIDIVGSFVDWRLGWAERRGVE